MAGRQWQRDLAKERFWRRMVRRWQGSGLTVRVFCNRFALSEPSFYAWRRILTQRDREAGASSHSGRPGACQDGSDQLGANRRAKTAPDTPSEMPRFVPVHVIVDDAAGSPPAPSIEVVLASGTLIRVPRGVDRQTLADVIAALEQRPC